MTLVEAENHRDAETEARGAHCAGKRPQTTEREQARVERVLEDEAVN